MIISSGGYMVVAESEFSGDTLFLLFTSSGYGWYKSYNPHDVHKSKLGAAKFINMFLSNRDLKGIRNLRIVEIVTEIKDVINLKNIDETIIELEIQEAQERLDYLKSKQEKIKKQHVESIY